MLYLFFPRLMPHTIKLFENHEKRLQQLQHDAMIGKEQVACAVCYENQEASKLATKESEVRLSDTLLSPDKTPTPFSAEECNVSLTDNNISGRQTKSSEKGQLRRRKKNSSSDSDDSNPTPVEDTREWSDPDPVQNDEWLDYLQRSMEEVMAGDLSCLLKPPLVAVATAPLVRDNASAKVIEYVASLLSIPFVIEDITSDNITTLIETYLESRIIDQIIQGTRILLTDHSTKMVSQFYNHVLYCIFLIN